MGLKANIIANYGSQLYVALLGIVVVPLYVDALGLEAYGLIGFFAMLQAWFGLLDLGLTPTISRETSRVNGGAISAYQYRQLFRSLSVLFAIIAFGGGLIVLSNADAIGSKWLKAQNISRSDVTYAVQIMVISISLRWMGGLYRGVISGYEKFVWLSWFNTIIASLRFLGVLGVMQIIGASAVAFFSFQACVAVIEFLVLLSMTYRLIPSRKEMAPLTWSMTPVKAQLKFAGAVAFTSSVWVVVTQIDKLMLSGLLSLTDYGNYSLAVLIASGITMVVAPIASSITPHITRLVAEERTSEIIAVYRGTTKLVSAFGGTAAITLIFLTDFVLRAWTGDAKVAATISTVVIAYAFGNMMLNFSSFAYSLQYAKGTLRFHVFGNVLMLAILAPMLYLFANTLGMFGAGLVWGVVNTAYLLIWVSYTHTKLIPGLNLKWLVFDILMIIIPLALIASIIAHWAEPSSSRLQNIIVIVLSGIFLLAVSQLLSKASRKIESLITTKSATDVAVTHN